MNRRSFFAALLGAMATCGVAVVQPSLWQRLGRRLRRKSPMADVLAPAELTAAVAQMRASLTDPAKRKKLLDSQGRPRRYSRAVAKQMAEYWRSGPGLPSDKYGEGKA